MDRNSNNLKIDEMRGIYFGTTFSTGNVVFDFYEQSRFYNAVVIGTMGAGQGFNLINCEKEWEK